MKIYEDMIGRWLDCPSIDLFDFVEAYRCRFIDRLRYHDFVAIDDYFKWMSETLTDYEIPDHHWTVGSLMGQVEFSISRIDEDEPTLMIKFLL